MLIRREVPGDVDVIRSVTEAAFAARPAGEHLLVDWLRADEGWIPALSLVAVVDDAVVGHVVCTRATVDDAPALGLGPLSVLPSHQRSGVGKALVHTVLGAADALDEPLVVLLGSPDYYSRFGFRLAASFGITPPVAEWAPHFQARALSAYDEGLRGAFRYSEPFDRL
ncbi:GNAT family N-acetyltransferase [Umezawaea endophytica]|uniref:N-acetyltransferase n=1 Tax=Umezawaea endophytica TaxID=1654476 RepID=A0A9X2VRF4_9PSEU|nr:N-acetyltransferase [Umezawaea endophytica]MCS7480143.1 N-acetyltransferase [Umezawaea endophytica]